MRSANNSPGGVTDLPPDIQRELLDLESRGSRLTHYELLGVPVDADASAIRRAYLERSKRFHPDAWYRKDLGQFSALLTRWFQRLSAAYQVLSEEESRVEYDQEHKHRLSDSDKVALHRRELSLADQERRAREGRERLMRTKGFARIGAAHKMYEEAQRLAAEGQRGNAIAALKAARELDPNRKEISARLLELEREQARARSLSSLVAGQQREEEGNLPKAISAYVSSFQNDPTNFAAAFGAARCSMRHGDVQAASTWAVRAVELNGGDVAVRLLLAQAFKAMNMKSRARGELTTLLSLDPNHKEAKALLRGL